MRTSRALYLALGMTAALAAAVILRTAILDLSPGALGQVAVLVVFTALTVVPILAPRRLLSAGFIYVLMLCIFHLSIPIVRTFHAAVLVRFSAYIDTWYGSRDVTEAIYLSMLAVMALTTAFAWMQVFHGRAAGTGRAASPGAAPPAFTQVGAALVITGVAGYLGVLALHAPQLLTGGTYRHYLDTVGGTPTIAGSTLLVAIGLCVAAVSGKSRARFIAWQTFGLFALITMSFGSRTAAMFAAVAATVAAAATAKRPLRNGTAAAIILGALISITVVQQIRETGLSSASVTSITVNPMDSLAETGGTVRTVAEVVKWRRTYQEPPYNGRTYLTPVVRAWERLTNQPRPEGSQDSRYAGVLLYQRFPELQLGFSPVAEAFLNFGTLGVTVIFAGLGVLLGAFDARRLGYRGAATLGVLMYALGYTVRNASNAIPVTVLTGLLIIWFATRLANIRARQTRSHQPLNSASSRELARHHVHSAAQELRRDPLQPRHPAVDTR